MTGVQAGETACPTKAHQGNKGRTASPITYLPTARIVNESGIIGPRPGPRPRPPPPGPRPDPPGAPPGGGGGGGAGAAVGAGGGAYSAVIVRIRLFFVSIVMVFAPGMVCTTCSATKLVGLFSLTIETVPSPAELNASIMAGLKPAPSVPA